MIDLMGTEPKGSSHRSLSSRFTGVDREVVSASGFQVPQVPIAVSDVNYRRKAIGGGKAEIRNTAPGRSGSISRDRKGMDKGPYSRV